jgi:hypothetical protein
MPTNGSIFSMMIDEHSEVLRVTKTSSWGKLSQNYKTRAPYFNESTKIKNMLKPQTTQPTSDWMLLKTS